MRKSNEIGTYDGRFTVARILTVWISVLITLVHGFVPAVAQTTSYTERFVIVGDSGKAGDGQTKVAAAIRFACQTRGGCDYGIMNGDNIYPAGVLSETDELWESNFEAAFGDLGFPFYASLGNHDYGGITETDEVSCTPKKIVKCLWGLGNAIQNRIAGATGGIGLDPSRVAHQLAYAASSDVFEMPTENSNAHYRFSTKLIDFVALDTTPIYWHDANEDGGIFGQFRLGRLKGALERLDKDSAPIMFNYARDQHKAQLDQVPIWRQESTKPWRIAFGHHPYLSNGAHGNAGSYNGTGGLEGDGLPLGTQLKSFLDEIVVNQGFHAYLYGHDHNLQDLGEYIPTGKARGTQMILSGAGSKLTNLRDGELDRGDDDAPHNKSLYQVKCYGFVMVEASAAELKFLYITVPSGEESDCASQAEPWKVAYERVVSHYKLE